MASSKYTIEEVGKAAKESRSWKQVCEKIGLKYAGGNVETLKKICGKNKISFSHFLGRGWNLGGDAMNEIDPSEVFIQNSPFIHKSTLKSKCLKYNLIENKCAECGLKDRWNGRFIVLHIDHINGDVTDNRINNLRFLCPNCHSQTDTYCVNVNDMRRKFCEKCSKPLSQKCKSVFCIECLRQENCLKKELKKELNKEKTAINRCRDRIHKRLFHISPEDLSELIQLKSMCEIARMFGVSDNAIRKRAKRYKLIPINQ